MTGASPSRTMAPPRLVVGKAQQTQIDGTDGRVLFPSPEFSARPPFAILADVSTRGEGPPVLHSHEREEVVNYVLSGVLVNYEPDGRTTEVAAGSADVFATVAPRMHDVDPRPGTNARWLSLGMRLPAGTPEPSEPYRVGRAAERPGPGREVKLWHVAGDHGPVRTLSHLELWEVRFAGPSEWEAPVGADRIAVGYVIEGTVRVGDHALAPMGGLLLEGYATVRVSGGPGSRMMLASVPVPSRPAG